MSAVLYGNIRAEIVSGVGVRLQRLTLRQATPYLPRSGQLVAVRKPLMLDREREVADAFAAVQAGRPAGFHAACGFGKTTLLQNIAATASERGLAASSVYLRADGNRIEDLLQGLVARLYVSDQPVKRTPQECAGLLGQVSALVVIDDLTAGPDQVGYLLDVLSGCSLVIGSARPVLGGRGSSYRLGGLPEETALDLVASDLGRPLTAEELVAARHLTAAVAGQPLHLRQCAALVRDGRHSLRSLARQAAHDPDVLDRLSINALAGYERRALAVLALAAGTLLPATVIETIGQVAYMGQWLESLHRRGLAEQRGDRFGLPRCKAESYRKMLFEDLHLAASARELTTWLTAANPSAAESGSAAEAALAIMEFAGERGDWVTVVRLARAAERVLFLAGRWEAWHHTLSQGLQAATASADKAAEAFFAHQQGTLAFCRDQLDNARRLLRHALTVREQIGDDIGAGVTRDNLRLLEPPSPPPLPRRSRTPRRALLTAGSVLGTLALAAGTVAILGALKSDPPAGGPPAGRSTSAAHANTPSPSPSQRPDPSPGQSQPSGPSPRQHLLSLAPAVLPAATVGLAYSQQDAATGGKPPYSFTVAAGALPPGLSLSTTGTISGTPTAPGKYQFTVAATDTSTPADTGSQPYTLQVAPPITIALSPTTLPKATAAVVYSQQITATGGKPPYSFTVAAGALPPGLSLSTTGTISGTPTAPGKYQFTVAATDASSTLNTGSRAYTLQITPQPVTLTLAPAALPAAQVGKQDTQRITAAGGTPPYSFSVTSGSLPAGLSLNSTTGDISGTSTTAGTYQFTITATDASSTPNTGSRAYTLQITPQPVTLALFPSELPDATTTGQCPAQPYTETITASGGTGPYSFSVTSGTLPDGMSLNSRTGVITGTPTTQTTYTFTITATDSSPVPNTGAQAYSVRVDPCVG